MDDLLSILPALLVGSGLKRDECRATGVDKLSPGFIGREWIETEMSDLQERARDVLPALLVGSGLKQVIHP